MILPLDTALGLPLDKVWHLRIIRTYVQYGKRCASEGYVHICLLHPPVVNAVVNPVIIIASSTGLYSRIISAQDDAGLQSMAPDQNSSELALARIGLKTCLEQQSKASPEVWLAYERTVTQYISLITSIIQKNALLHRDDKEAFMTVMEMINQVNEEQGVH